MKRGAIVEAAVANPEQIEQRSDSDAPARVCLSVIIPVYNERDTVAEIIRRVREASFDKEIIVVDDGSTDGTRELLEAMLPSPDLRIVYQPANRGKGAALRAGFLHAAGDIVLVQDADLEYDPADYPTLLQPILDGQADVVFGSRFLDPNARAGLSVWHRLGNRLLTMVSNLFTGLRLTDMETCYKVFRRDVIRALAPGLKQDRFGFEPEITAKVARARCRVLEVPIRYSARTYQQGKKIGWRDVVNALWCILRYWRRD